MFFTGGHLILYLKFSVRTYDAPWVMLGKKHTLGVSVDGSLVWSPMMAEITISASALSLMNGCFCFLGMNIRPTLPDCKR